ncbi:OLC1v1025846C1 [Oldenlandia corymbosa var. corymbosa]|uniref:OLC1v1025846C1 n=1 Tax=Oldenlandia corymbosa var. corymbosa TaxID=529605 RepID=A0AAV1C739_OLDCO|nr:OLC1v1025846C1 [Oldenlandia corymbosa var. corymbosa]
MGETTRFWNDVWLDLEKPIKHYIHTQLPLHTLKKKIKDYVDINGNWKWSEINIYVPEEIRSKILSTPPPDSQTGPDKAFWRWTRKGSFTTASAYQQLKQ